MATGVYRLPEIPETANDPYMLAVLWTNTPNACLSHDTALAVRALCDINPDKIHLTVPRGRRIRRAGGELYAVHREDLAAEQRDWWENVPTATVSTAIRQCTESGTPTYLLRQALGNARGSGAIRSHTATELEALLDGRDDQR